MKHFAKLMLSTLGIGVVAIVLFSLPRHTAAASSGPPAALVTVTNTPLPVTGSVNAAVTGTVGITGTVPVSVPNPLPVQPVKQSTANYLTISCPGADIPSCYYVTNAPSFSFQGGRVFPIPAGDQLVVTDMAWSVRCYSPGTPGQAAEFYLILTNTTDQLFSDVALFDSQGVAAGRTEHFTSGLVLTNNPPSVNYDVITEFTGSCPTPATSLHFYGYSLP